MTRARIITWAAAGLLAVGLYLPAFYAHAAEDVDIVTKLQSAKTPADHEAIASYYDVRAAEAKKQAEKHRKMADSYTVAPALGGKPTSPTPMPQHCHSLVKAFEAEAAEYTAMAEAHRAAAKSAK